jgi:hypothetical protein
MNAYIHTHPKFTHSLNLPAESRRNILKLTIYSATEEEEEEEEEDNSGLILPD